MSENRKLPISRLSTYVGKTQKVECLRLPLTLTSAVLRGKSAKFNQPCFALVQFQMKLAKTVFKRFNELLGILSVLKTHDKVIAKPHDDDIATSLLASPLLDPKIEYVMQVDVGKHRTDASALRHAFFAVGSTVLFEHTSVQPLLDVP